MKKYFYLSISFFLFGCENFLNVEPREAVSINEQFSTLEGFKLALNGAYFKTEDLLSSKFFIYPDVMAGNIIYTPARTGANLGEITKFTDFIKTYDFNDDALESEFKEFYENSYKVINNVNNIIFYLQTLNEGSALQKQQIKAEALVIRAFVYYNLLQIYSQNYAFSTNANHKGIAYVDRILVGGVDFPARQTCAETYDLIQRDLQESLLQFTSNQALSGPRYSFFNSISTKAFLARVALQKRDWALAITAANDVIATSAINLMSNSNYISEWSKPLLPVSEVILEFSAPKDNQNLTVTSSVSKDYKIILNQNGSVADYGNCAASLDLINLFDTNDIRKSNFIEQLLPKKISNVLMPTNYYFTKKHQDNPGTISIRLSEMYLILAEAYARLGNSSQALIPLNVIRQRAGLNALTTNSNLLDEIFLERRRELCFESSLFFDCARFNKSINRNLGCISLLCNLSYPNNRFVLPIPQNTITVNQNMIQNEGY